MLARPATCPNAASLSALGSASLSLLQPVELREGAARAEHPRSFALHGISMILSLAGEAPTTVPAKGASRKILPVCGQVLTDTRLIRPTSSEPNMERNPRPL